MDVNVAKRLEFDPTDTLPGLQDPNMAALLDLQQ
jgi:hypothetical protein